jgi:hypothetical protein
MSTRGSDGWRPRLVPWLLRAVWIVVGVAGSSALDGALNGADATARGAVQLITGVMWLLGVAAMAIPAVVSLTATRLLVPLSVPASVTAWIAGSEPLPGAVFLAAGVFATVVAYSADVGRAFVQASAYGEEDRHLLRPPIAYLVPSVLTWMIWDAAWVAGVVLVGRSQWLIGTLLLAAGLLVAAWGWRRWHRLSRRWFVIVPVGVVVHDHLVLAETLMVKRNELAGLRLAPAGTGAADFTGPTTGHAVELLTHEPVTAISAATPAEPRGKAIHLTGCIVAPTRPGRLLAAAQARRLPVG